MKVEIVPYEPAHAYALFDRQVREADFMLSSVGDWEAAAKEWGRAGPAFTLLLDGEPEACGGIMMRDPGFGECWLVVPRVNHGCTIYRNVLRKMHELLDVRKFRRLQAFVMADFDNGVKLVQRLGFEKEGSLRQFGPGGETVDIYARVF